MKKYLKLFYLIGSLAGMTPAYGWFGITKESEPRYSEAQIVEMKAEHNYTGLVFLEENQDKKPDMILNAINMMSQTTEGEKLLNNLIDNNAAIYTETPQIPGAAGSATLNQQKISVDLNRMIKANKELDTFHVVAHESEHIRHLNNAKKNNISVKGRYNNLVLITIMEALAERKAAQIISQYLSQQPTDHPFRKLIDPILIKNNIQLPEYSDFVFQQRMLCTHNGYFPGQVPDYSIYESQSLALARENSGVQNPDWNKIISIMSDGEITELNYLPLPRDNALRSDMMNTVKTRQPNAMPGQIALLLDTYKPENISIFSQWGNKIVIHKCIIIYEDGILSNESDEYLNGYQYGVTEISIREALDIAHHYAQGRLADCKNTRERKQILSDLRLINQYQRQIGDNADYRADCHKRTQNRILSKLEDTICATDKKKELKLHWDHDDNFNTIGFKSSSKKMTVLETTDLIIGELAKDIAAGKGDQRKLTTQKVLLEALKDEYSAKPGSLLETLAQELTDQNKPEQNLKTALGNHSNSESGRSKNTTTVETGKILSQIGKSIG